jgi:hypothetical protein
MILLSIKILIFIGSSGLIYQKFHEKTWLVRLTGLVAIVSFVLLLKELVSLFSPTPANVNLSSVTSWDQKFQAAPTSFGTDLAVNLKKGRTEISGHLTVFACKRQSPGQLIIGEADFKTAPEEFDFRGEFTERATTLLIVVDPIGSDSFTVIAPWDLARLQRLERSFWREGSLTCLDVRGLL